MCRSHVPDASWLRNVLIIIIIVTCAGDTCRRQQSPGELASLHGRYGLPTLLNIVLLVLVLVVLLLRYHSYVFVSHCEQPAG